MNIYLQIKFHIEFLFGLMNTVSITGGGEIVTGEAEAYVYGDTVPYDIQRRRIAFDILKPKKNSAKVLLDKLPGILCIDEQKTFLALKKEIKKVYKDCTRRTEATRLINHYRLWDRNENMLDLFRLRFNAPWETILRDPNNFPDIKGKLRLPREPKWENFKDPPKKPQPTMMEMAEYILVVHTTLERYMNKFEVYCSVVGSDIKKLITYHS